MKYLLLIFCLLFNGSAQTQSLYSNVSKETGRPLINYYGPKDYKADPRNLAIVQDSKGIIYVGNNSGAVLEFDGVTWRHIILPNNLAVESLEKDKHGNIYVGGTKDFGFLKPDSNGNLCFKSLLKYVNKQDRIFTRIKVNVTREGVYFLSSRRLFLWKNNMLKTWRSQTDFRSSFYVNNNFYVDDEENGLMIMKNGILMQMPGKEKLPSDELIAMFTYPDFSGINSNYYDKSLLLCFAKKGLFIYKGNTLQPLTGPANEFIKKNGIRCGSLLNDSTFAVGTLQKGAIVFNKNGEIIRLINNPWHKDDIVYSIIPDRVGGMWMAMQQGIDHVIGINAGYSLFDHILGLDGVVLALPSPIRHNGILYVSTTTGVYYLDKQQSRFYVVEGLSGSFWNLFEFNKSLFAVRGSIRKIDYNRTKLVKRLTEPAVSVHRSSVNPDKVYMGIKDGGLKILKMNKGKWIEDGRIKGIYETIRNMAEEKNGDLWLGIESDGVIHIRFSAYDKIPEIERYGTQQGLPPGRIYVYKTSLYPVFSTNRGLFKFNKMSAVLFPIQYSENLWPTVRE